MNPAIKSWFLAGLMLLPFGIAWAVPAAAGTTVDAAVCRAGENADAARRELNRTFARIRAEKKQAIKRLEDVEKQVRELREKYEQAATDQENLAARIETVRRERERLEEIEKQIRTVALDYRQAFETRLAGMDAERLGSRLEGLDNLLEKKNDGIAKEALSGLIALAAGHATGGIGGHRAAGAAVDLEGGRHQGEFVRIGPLTYFHAGDDALAGVAVQQVGSTLPTVFQQLDPGQLAGIKSLFATGAGTVPVDVTMGSAVQLRQTEETWSEHLRKGGMVMIPLLGLAAVCILIALFKTGVILRLATSRSQGTVLRIVAALQAEDVDKALELAKTLRRPLAPVIREGIDHRHAAKEHLEEILYEQILNQVPGLERFLSALAVCASAAPLLGLLGTVTGMIHTFRLITVFGTGDARLLSSGISEALITTEVGLMIAIPALLVHAFLSRRLRRAVALAQETAATFVNGLKLKGNNDT
jgi:biopolymer transport protein ExbB